MFKQLQKKMFRQRLHGAYVCKQKNNDRNLEVHNYAEHDQHYIDNSKSKKHSTFESDDK